MQHAIESLEDHPNARDVIDVLARMVDLSDTQLCELASVWCNDEQVSAARAKALSPDSPLVLEALAAFDSLAFLYADDLAGTADFVTVPAPVTALALKAVRDAIAAAYARPILTAAEHARLVGPWRQVFDGQASRMPDFGPQHSAVIELLSALPHLACRSHDVHATARYAALLSCGLELDPESHSDAFDRAWHAAITTQRRRLWNLATRSAQESFYRRCGECTRSAGEDEHMVLALCLGAVMGVLMRDVLDDASAATLSAPAAMLVPQQRLS